MLEEYYNKETKTLSIPWNFNEELTDLPFDTKIIIFEEDLSTVQYSKFNHKVGHQGCEDVNCPRNLPNSLTHLTFGFRFNQKVNNLPVNLTHLSLGRDFNQKVDNLPLNIEEIKIYDVQKSLLKKIPFGCKILNEYDKEIIL